MTKKAIFFVDGNNWYHNVKKYFEPSEIDITKVANFICFIKKYELVEIRWYVSIPSIEDGELMYFRHLTFLDHLKNWGVKVITRKLQRLPNKEIQKRKKEILDSLDLCNLCKPLLEAHFFDLTDVRRKEKGIDVSIVVDMITKCILKNECEVCVLISGDADFVPALNLLKENKKEVLSSAVPIGYSSELRKFFPYFILKKETLIKCLRDYKKL